MPANRALCFSLETKKYVKFFQKLITFISLAFSQKQKSEEERLNLVYSALRYIKFVVGDKK